MSGRGRTQRLAHETCQYARYLKRYVSHDHNLYHRRLLLLLLARDENGRVVVGPGGYRAVDVGGARSRAERARVARVETRLAGGCGPGGIDAGGGRRRSAAAGRLRRTPPRPAPTVPAPHYTQAPSSSRTSRAAASSTRRPTTFQFPLHPLLI